MALPGEKKNVFPTAYLTKVPEKIRRLENRLLKTGGFPEAFLDLTPKFITHEDDRLYFDYGAARLGRRPVVEGAGEARLVCVGFGWLPGWRFTVTEQGLPDIVPDPGSPSVPKTRARSGAGAGEATPAEEQEPGGVLGLLFKLVPGADPAPKRSPFAKKTAVDVRDLPCAGPQDWARAVPFHAKSKTLRQVRVYIHVFDGGVGHRYRKDGTVVPFRTPDWPVGACVHVDPERAKLSHEKAKRISMHLQGDWVGEALQRWIKEAGLPAGYVEQTLRKWVADDPGVELKVNSGGLLGFLGFRR